MIRRAIFVVAGVLVILTGGCAVQEKPATPSGPFEIAILVTTDTRGEVEPCG